MEEGLAEEPVRLERSRRQPLSRVVVTFPTSRIWALQKIGRLTHRPGRGVAPWARSKGRVRGCQAGGPEITLLLRYNRILPYTAYTGRALSCAEPALPACTGVPEHQIDESRTLPGLPSALARAASGAFGAACSRTSSNQPSTESLSSRRVSDDAIGR